MAQSHADMKLHLIRHGQSTSNAEGRVQGRLDIPLSERGLREAELLAERLASMPIAALYASPLRRAKSTAQAVATRLGLGLQERDFLMERDVGELAGLTGDEISEQYPDWRERRQQANPEDVFPGYEADDVFHERVVPNMRALIEAHPDEEIAVVTHGGVIGVFCRDALGITVRRTVELHNASLSTYHAPDDGNGGQLMTLNDTCHLRE